MTHTLTAKNIQWKVGERTILSDIHLQCRTGRITGLLGRNGSGKTSLMRIIYGDLPCDSRSVTIDNHLLTRPYTQPDRIRYMPQFDFIPGALTLERVCLDFNLDMERFIEVFPEFHPHRRHRIQYLSTGQRRLIDIYIITRSRTQFVMLDEPFTLLSPIQIEKVKVILEEEKQNKGILITDHLHRHILDLSDEVYTLKNGRARLMDASDSYRVYF
ncbi:MAG TPA: ATP-binding cassette domain-containing protein [Puia sp.]|nr:ATP-binding cassette domain-containing protein [Puia sp.]